MISDSELQQALGDNRGAMARFLSMVGRPLGFGANPPKQKAEAALMERLGAETLQEAQQAVDGLNMFVDMILEVTATADLSGAESAVRAAFSDQEPNDVARLLAAAGADSVDAAIGSIATMRQARDEFLPQAREENAKLRSGTVAREEVELLAQLKMSNRISPSQERAVWPHLSLEAKRSFAATAPVIELTQDKGIQESAIQPGTVTSSGKAYADMTFSEKAALKRENLTLYQTLRNQHEGEQ